MAHTVHGARDAVPIALLLMVSACVIPPSLSVDNQDAGVNSPPAIVGIRSDQQDLPEPGPVTFERGRGTLNATLLDTDVDDSLFVRVFVDYTTMVPTPARSTCSVAGGTGPQRTLTCDIGGLCLPGDIGVTRDMTVVVFDRQPLDAGTPRFQAMAPDGLKTSWFYHLHCQEASE